MHDPLVGKPDPPHGWIVFTGILFASSGWMNVLLWVITGRQFGFTAASVRTVSDEEVYDFENHVLKPHANVGARLDCKCQQASVRSPEQAFMRPIYPLFPLASPASVSSLESL